MKPSSMFPAYILILLSWSYIGAGAENDSSLEEEKKLYRELLQEGEPAYTEEDVMRLLKEVIPAIEEATGKRFLSPPTLKVVSRQVLVEAIERDTFLQLKAMDPAGEELLLQLDAMAFALSMAPAFIAKYGIVDRVIYMPAGNLKPILAIAGIAEVTREGIMKVTLAHELTHALQDQHHNLQRLHQAVKDRDASLALQVVLEGHALLVQEQVARKMGLEESSRALDSMLPGGGLMKRKFPKLTATAQARPNLALIEAVYKTGKSFMELRFMEGGHPGLWGLVASPPRSFSTVLSETEAARSTGGAKNLLQRIEKLEDLFGPGPWKGVPKTGGGKEVGSLLAQAEAETSLKAVEEVERFATRVVMGNIDRVPTMFVFTLYQVRRPEFLPDLQKASEKVFQLQLEKQRKQGRNGEYSRKPTDLPGEGDKGAGLHLVWELKLPDSSKINMTVVQLWRGNFFFQAFANRPVTEAQTRSMWERALGDASPGRAEQPR